MAPQKFAQRIYQGNAARVVHRSGAKASLALQAAGILFICATGFAFASSRSGPQKPAGFDLLVIVPATSALVFSALAIILPGLLAVRRLGFPLNVTLPLVFAMLQVLCATLWAHGPSRIVLFPALHYATAFWLRASALATLCVIQFAALSLVGYLTRVNRDPE